MRFLIALLLIISTSCDNSTPMEQITPCGNPCSMGDAICNTEGRLVLCEGPDEDGCFAWGTPQNCGESQRCSDGACICDDQCESGVEMCGPNQGRLACEGPDEAGCFHWGEEQPCDPDPCPELCGCENRCLVDETICGEGGGVLTCEGPDEDGCFDWSDERACPESQTCSLGACQCNNQCEPETFECRGTDAQVVCGEPDEYGCYDWAEPTECGEYQDCVEEVGGCMPDTPIKCFEVNECLYEEQIVCMDKTRYRGCHFDSDGCLIWDCGT